MRKYLLVISVIFVLSCQNQKRLDKVPKGIIPKDKMVELLVDIHLADGIIAMRKFDSRKHEYQIEGYYKYLYEKHGYNREIIDSSIRFYSRYPAEYDIIYDEVFEKLSKIESEIESEKETD